MRTLDFIVEGQNIEESPNCDFSGIISGSSGYLQARFRFSPEWRSMVKAAVFSERNTVENVLITDNICTIPASVLTRKSFKIKVVGQGKNKSRVTTNTLVIRQDL